MSSFSFNEESPANKSDGEIELDKVCETLDANPNDLIYFHKKLGPKGLKAHEVVNKMLCPFGFEDFSEEKFKIVAGGSKHSANLIPNYRYGRGKVKNGYTKLKDIAEYCNSALQNSFFIPVENVIKWFKWSKKALNEGYITRYSGAKERYDIEAILDLTKGHMPEEAFKHSAGKKGHEAELDRRLYGGTRDTDRGQDVLKINGKKPELTIQIKDVQWFYLVSKTEFKGPRSAGIYIGYKTHWRKSELGQMLFRLFDEKGEVFGDVEPLQGIRVEKRGWAWPIDFDYLPSGKSYKGKSFKDDNYFVYWQDLRSMERLPWEKVSAT